VFLAGQFLNWSSLIGLGCDRLPSDLRREEFQWWAGSFCGDALGTVRPTEAKDGRASRDCWCVDRFASFEPVSDGFLSPFCGGSLSLHAASPTAPAAVPTPAVVAVPPEQLPKLSLDLLSTIHTAQAAHGLRRTFPDYQRYRRLVVPFAFPWVAVSQEPGFARPSCGVCDATRASRAARRNSRGMC
jgi:hypothetical protein